MSNESIRPSTLDGIKRLAKSLKVERGIQHAEALDLAAQYGGYQNFRHARNALLKATPKAENPRPIGHRIFLTAYWKDRESDGSGRETLTIWLSVPWGKLITAPQLKLHRALGNFRAAGADHLERQNTLGSQSEAQRTVCAAARALHFMDATKLRPSKSYSRTLPGGQWNNAIPGCDHHSAWYDRETKRYLFADEPYEKAVENRVHERENWAQRHGYAIVKPEWAGMYAPDVGSRLYLVSDEAKGIPLQTVVDALDKLPAPIVEATWGGESAPRLPRFVSPGGGRGATGKGEPQQSPILNGQRNSVGYVQTFVGPRRRPKGRMPIHAHTEIGQLLKSVLAVTYKRKGVYNRVGEIRSELDEWVQREYSYEELPQEQFSELYYHDPEQKFPRSLPEPELKHHAESLMKVRKLLEQHYPACPPLRSVLKKMDAAMKSLRTWT